MSGVGSHQRARTVSGLGAQARSSESLVQDCLNKAFQVLTPSSSRAMHLGVLGCCNRRAWMLYWGAAATGATSRCPRPMSTKGDVLGARADNACTACDMCLLPRQLRAAIRVIGRAARRRWEGPFLKNNGDGALGSRDDVMHRDIIEAQALMLVDYNAQEATILAIV